jgi:type IV pilus assembly protein PilX
MNTLPQSELRHGPAKQRGVVLFFTLIALVVMSLAAVALIRSVDTSTMIAGNLAFKQAGTSSGDAGIEAAIAWLGTAQATAQTAGLKILMNPAHPLNNTGGIAVTGSCCLNVGYYSNADPALSLTNSTGTRINWDNTDSALVLDPSGNTTDISGNTVRYVIQRMCRTANKLPNTIEKTPSKTGCLFSSAALDKNGMSIPYADQICSGIGCPTGGQTALLRITTKVTGSKNTVSYVQTIVY